MSSAYSQSARRRQTKSRIGSANRDSNAVRASVLQTALELGIAQNPTVANWIFNNPLDEEPEDLFLETTNDKEPETEVVELITPTLTYSSNTTSDDSSMLNSPQNNVAGGGAGMGGLQVHMHKPSVTEPPHVHFDDFPSENLQLFSLPVLSSDTQSTTSRGYGSLAVRPSKDSQGASSQDDSLRYSRGNESPSPGPGEAGYSSEGQHFGKSKKSGKERGKDKFDKKRIKKWIKPAALDLSKGDDREGDYASDGGYLSASSNKSQGKSPSKTKSRAMAFFRRRQKKSERGSDDDDDDDVPPVPAIPVLPKPSSPMPLSRNGATPSSAGSGFAPLALNLSGPPRSPKRGSSRSPPPVRVTPAPSPRLPDNPSKPTSTSVPTGLHLLSVHAPPFPSSAPSTPLSTTSFSPPASPSPASKASIANSRHHLSIPPPAPPPSQPLPQLPPSSLPANLPRRVFSPPPVPPSPTTPARRVAPQHMQALPAPVVMNSTYTSLAPVEPLSPRRNSSPLRSHSVRPGLATAHAQAHTGNVTNPPGRQNISAELAGLSHPTMVRQYSAPAVPSGTAPTTALLQRRLHGQQNGVFPPTPPRPPPDAPLPPAPCPVSSNASSRLPTNSFSKFHEHFSSVSSVSHILSAPTSTPASRSPSRSGSSSGPSVNSSHTSSSEQRYSPLPTPNARTSGTTTATAVATDESRSQTSSSRVSGSSYGQPVPQPIRLVSRFSDASVNLYARLARDSIDDDEADADVEEVSKEVEADDDDASCYPSDEKTAGRRTMYLVENGQVDECGDEVVVAGSHYWGREPCPPLPTRSRQGYF
ncbi:hypothetical protein ID866_1896 [Astraeus odoratus]|nr:hypothetical protein ID866_1896 [Astraeus odoratus]